jgi:hypothetical protein
MTSDGAQQRLEAGCPAWSPDSGYAHISTTELNELTAERGQLLIALDAWRFEAEVTAARLAQVERVVEATRAWRAMLDELDAVAAYNRPREIALIAAVDALDGTAGPGEKTHRYLSTACLHQIHERCRLTCKTCSAPCTCPCHIEATAGPGEEGTT